ncbi:bifunctional DNA primase/helicase [Microbacterium sp. BR1]|uniref:bifunctional DNA primase/helicase n=1 Tax=Microbacterium sp. BR1 TaxID=1070896 RepID=UPI000C2B9D79|nr:bifunctional DNA primase/helicase [Microbacterium sp. BR1]
MATPLPTLDTPPGGGVANAAERFTDALRQHGETVRAAGSGRWIATCPAHADKSPSLSVTERAGDPGRVLAHCHAGCQLVDVVASLGLELRDLFDGSPERVPYRYDSGRVAWRVLETGSRRKQFRQTGTDRPAELWRLAHVREGVEAGADVFVTEGEEDALTLEAIAAPQRIAATTAPMGAANWSQVDYGILAGAPVIVVADNDTAGVRRGLELTTHLESIGAVVRGVVTARDGLNDVTDALAAWTGDAPMTLEDLRSETVAQYRARVGGDVATAEPDRARVAQGGSFIFDSEDNDEPIWGDAERVAWAPGESCMVYSAPGVGKSTLAGLLVRARMGLERVVLGMPVRADERRVLYLAADRPRQIARALRRQFTEDERPVLDERLRVWRGPLLDDLAAHPMLLLELAREAGAGTLVVDSIKDVAARLSEDEGGRSFNVARQHCLAEGVEVLELHHARKAPGEGRRSLNLDDVYGSTWLVAGAGSVLGLIGEATDTTVELRGMRVPRGDVGPLKVAIDRARGTMSAEHAPTALDALRGQGALLAKQVAQIQYGRDDVTRAEESRTRRELDKLTKLGQVERLPVRGVAGGVERIAYVAATESGGMP